jgi:galactokinase/mevalonate kinase-like predicted kinase
MLEVHLFACDQHYDSHEAGVEICSFSALPAGSGMGGSSILAAVIIQAVLELMNRCCSLELLQRMVYSTFIASC